MSFGYKHVLIFGATSGIGLALAEKMIENGSRVIAVGRRQENLDSFVKKHGSEKASSYAFDISDLKAIPSFVEKVSKAHPDIDSVLLNSGMQRKVDFTKPESIDLDAVNNEMTVNYNSYFALIKYFLPILTKQSEQTPTSIMFTTSGLALTPILRCPNYCASKAALHHLILVLREQLKGAGSKVKVIEILPPAVQTELHDAKHQPDLGDSGKSIGMPLDEFIDETWKGLEAGKEQIPVGMAANGYKAFEEKRQEIFHKMIESMK